MPSIKSNRLILKGERSLRDSLHVGRGHLRQGGEGEGPREGGLRGDEDHQEHPQISGGRQTRNQCAPEAECKGQKKNGKFSFCKLLTT